MKKELIQKLKAFILDPSASEGEQQNAIVILLTFKNKWFDVWDIPEPVRPKKDEKVEYENISKVPQVYIKVFTSIKETYWDAFVSKKTPYERVKKSSFNIPISVGEEWLLNWKVTIEKETVYKTKFFHYRMKYVRFDKVSIEDFTVIEKWTDYFIDSTLIEESESFLLKRIYWHEDAFNEYSDSQYEMRIPYIP